MLKEMYKRVRVLVILGRVQPNLFAASCGQLGKGMGSSADVRRVSRREGVNEKRFVRSPGFELIEKRGIL